MSSRAMRFTWPNARAARVAPRPPVKGCNAVAGSCRHWRHPSLGFNLDLAGTEAYSAPTDREVATEDFGVKRVIRYDDTLVESMIHTIRGQRVILDSDLAKIYGVPTKRLNEQVRRNIERFPPDFAFVMTSQEAAIFRSQYMASGAQVIGNNTDLMNRSQFATGSSKHRDPRFAPQVFTEHGAIMAANVLNSPKAIPETMNECLR